MQTSVLVLFPGALGDFICLWPTLQSLRGRATSLTVVTRPSFFDLLDRRHFSFISIDRREIADLFASDPLSESTRRLLGGHGRALSWTGADDPRFTKRL